MREAEGRTRYIIQTKFAGMSGSLLLSVQRRKELLSRYSEEFLDGCGQFEALLSVGKEEEAARQAGASRFLEAGRGGIFGALWEVEEAENSGMDILLSKILFRQETIEICEYFDISPYRLLSGGCSLIVSDRPEELAKELWARRIPWAVIGRLHAGRDRVAYNGDGLRYLEPVRGDEYDRIMAPGRRARNAGTGGDYAEGKDIKGY